MKMNNLKVEECKTLDELCEMLNQYSEAYANLTCTGEEALMAELSDVVDICDLPIFGNNEPKCTLEIFSWDDTRALTQNPCAGEAFMIVDRTEVTNRPTGQSNHFPNVGEMVN
jgi:hypothetical protein